MCVSIQLILTSPLSYSLVQGILKQLLKYKLLFIETQDAAETALALENYYKVNNDPRVFGTYLGSTLVLASPSLFLLCLPADP